MELIIKRSKWLRGEGGENSFLLRESDGKMCCLGFYGKVIGISAYRLKGYRSPTDNKASYLEFKKRAPWLLHDRLHLTQSTACISLILNNDSKVLDANREELIALIFAENNVIVKFVD